MSQSALDAAIDPPATRGTVGQLESGVMLPPDRDMCAKLDRALKLAEGTMWEECAPYRLRRFDPDLDEWRREQSGLDPQEERLIALVRRTDGMAPGHDTVALMLSQALEAVLDGPRIDPDRPQDADPLPDGQVYRLPPQAEVRNATLPLGTQRELGWMVYHLLGVAIVAARGEAKGST